MPRPPRAELYVRVGVDIVSVPRLARLVTDHPGITEELFTSTEIAYCEGKKRRMEHLAARFAAKEAVLKALGTGLASRMSWSDVEIVNNALGKPVVKLHGRVAKMARSRRAAQVEVSLAHTEGLSIAQAVVVMSKPPS